MKDKEKKSRAPMVTGLLLLAAAGGWLAFRLLWSGPAGIPGESERQRIEYIESFGWNAGTIHSDVKEIRIPGDFDEVYEEYNAVQLSQSAVSHQLRVLKDTKLVRFRRDGKTVYYALDDDHVRSILSMGMDHIEE